MQTETVNRLIAGMHKSIGAGEKGAQELLAAIQKIQQLSRKEGDRITTFDSESDRLLGLYRKLRDEIVKLSPSGENED